MLIRAWQAKNSAFRSRSKNATFKIRYFGFQSHRVKKESVERVRSLADPNFVAPETREETAGETITRLLGEDVCLCPKCRKGRMTKILELPKPKILQRRVRIVVIDSS